MIRFHAGDSLRDRTEFPERTWTEFPELARVESTHNILDTAFEEDEHTIITADAKAAYCVLLLRRIAHDLVASYRNIN